MSKTSSAVPRLCSLFRHHVTASGTRFKSTTAPASAGKQEGTVGEGKEWGERGERKGEKVLKDMPGPPGLPYLGSMLKYRTGSPGIDGMKEILTDTYQQYGGMVREKVAGRTRVHVFDPERVREVYRQEGKWPQIEPLVETTQMFRQEFQHSPGLGNTNGEEWYRLRSGVHQLMMRPKEVAAYLPLVDDVTVDLTHQLNDLRDQHGKVKDINMLLSKWNLETAANIAFDERKHFMTTNSRMAEAWVSAQIAIMREAGLLRYALPWYRLLATPKWKNLVKAEEYLTRECQRMVKDALTRLGAAEQEGQTLEDQDFKFLRGLLSSRVLTNRDIVTLVLSLLTDGLPSTVPTTLSALYCLATNPEQQERLREELHARSALHQPLTPEALAGMTYLKACVKETLRLFPVTLEISRMCPADMTLGEYVLPQGTCLKLNNFVAHRDPTYFPDPESFRPERWLRQQGEEPASGRGKGKEAAAGDLTSHPYRYIPFGHGPRMCPGRRFAEQDLQVVTARLLHKFHVQWEGQCMGQRWETLMRPDCPLAFTFTPRY